MNDDFITTRYTGQDYQARNPTWDAEDSPWKAARVEAMLTAHRVACGSLAEIGCGAGGVLAELRRSRPEAALHGFDIAPALVEFWERHAGARIDFELGDFLAVNRRHYDVILLLDVVEHLANPSEFLAQVRTHADHFVFHFPLDLSASTVLRESPLLHVRRKVGHLHFFTKNLALALLEDCGYTVVDWSYTGAAFNAPQRTWKTRLASAVRLMAYAVNKDVGVRMLGGETLLILARPAPPE